MTVRGASRAAHRQYNNYQDCQDCQDCQALTQGMLRKSIGLSDGGRRFFW